MGAKGIARGGGFKQVFISMALVIFFIFAFAGPAASNSEGRYPSQPPGEAPPSGGDPGFCTEVPAGLYDQAVMFAGAVINKWYSEFPDFPNSYPSLDKIREIVYEAANETGISNTILIEWMVNEAATHSPGGMCFKDPNHPPTYPGGDPGAQPPDDGYPGHTPPKNIFKKRFKLLTEVDGESEYDSVLDATLIRVLNLPRKYESHPGKHHGDDPGPGDDDQGGPGDDGSGESGDDGSGEPGDDGIEGPGKYSDDDQPDRGSPPKGGPFDELEDAGIFLDIKRAMKRDRFYDADGNKVSLDAILEARLVMAKTKLMKMDKWLEDDGDPLPTFRTYKLIIEVPGGVLAKRACDRYRKARASGRVKKLGKRAYKSTCRAARQAKRKLKEAVES